MQFLVNFTLHEIIFDKINQKIKEGSRKKKTAVVNTFQRANANVSISSKLGTVPLHQLFEALNKIDKINASLSSSGAYFSKSAFFWRWTAQAS